MEYNKCFLIILLIFVAITLILTCTLIILMQKSTNNKSKHKEYEFSEAFYYSKEKTPLIINWSYDFDKTNNNINKDWMQYSFRLQACSDPNDIKTCDSNYIYFVIKGTKIEKNEGNMTFIDEGSIRKYTYILDERSDIFPELTPNTTYYLTIRADYNNNTSNWTTPSEPSSIYVTDTKITFCNNISSNTITCPKNSTLVCLKDENGAELKFDCQCGTVNQSQSDLANKCVNEWKNSNLQCVQQEQDNTFVWMCGCGTSPQNLITSTKETCPAPIMPNDLNLVPSTKICNNSDSDESKWSWDCGCGDNSRNNVQPNTEQDPYLCSMIPSQQTPMCYKDPITGNLKWADCNCRGRYTSSIDNMLSTSATNPDGAVNKGGCNPSSAVCDYNTYNWFCPK